MRTPPSISTLSFPLGRLRSEPVVLLGLSV